MSAQPAALRVALCKNSLYGPISGADETLVTYACHLRRIGHDPTVVLLYRPKAHDVFHRRLREASVPVVIIASRSRLYELLRRARRLTMLVRQTISPAEVTIGAPPVLTATPPARSAIVRMARALVRRLALRHLGRGRSHFRSAGYDIAHVFTPDSGAEVMIRAASAVGTPTLYHEMGTPYHMPELDGAYRRLAKVTRLCTRVAALSPILARQWTPYLPHAADMMVQPLIVGRPFQWVIPRRPTDGATIIGFAARLQIGKGPQILLDALARVRRGGRAARLRLAGSGELMVSLRVQARRLGIADDCEFSGAFNTREGGAAFLATLDIFVLPSFAEGTPNSIIEAMAAGVPVIASDVGGIRDIITPDVGVVTPSGDVNALAEAIARLADDPTLCRAMGDAGRRRYEERFAPEAGLAGLLATYAAVRSAGQLP